MKSTKTPAQAAAASGEGKVKIKALKLTKETVENLSHEDAAVVRGGGKPTQTLNSPSSSTGY